VALGADVFKDKCVSCHAMGEGEEKRGPEFSNLIGRPAASLTGCTYSDAMMEATQAGLVWDVATLDRFLTKPRNVVNGSFMDLTGLNHPEDMGNVIAYLATSSPRRRRNGGRSGIEAPLVHRRGKPASLLNRLLSWSSAPESHRGSMVDPTGLVEQDARSE
jgi:cytochrome c